MVWFPSRVVDDNVGHIVAKYGMTPAMIRGILGEFLESLHEASSKGSPFDALRGVYSALGPEAAWHFWSLIYLGLYGEDEDILRDTRADWLETALRLDSRMQRFSGILERWAEEKEFELEQQE